MKQELTTDIFERNWNLYREYGTLTSYIYWPQSCGLSSTARQTAFHTTLETNDMAASRTYSMIITISKSWTKASLYWLQIEGSNKSYKLAPKKKEKVYFVNWKAFFILRHVRLVQFRLCCCRCRVSTTELARFFKTTAKKKTPVIKII